MTAAALVLCWLLFLNDGSSRPLSEHDEKMNSRHQKNIFFFFTCCWHKEKQGDYAAVVLRLEFLRLMVMSRTDTVDIAQSDVLVRCSLIFLLMRNRCIALAGLSSCVCAFANRSSKCVCQIDANVSSLVCLHLLSRTLQNTRSKYPTVQRRPQ